VKAQIAEFLLSSAGLQIGDTIMIKGRTTGEEIFILNEMYCKKSSVSSATAGDTITLKTNFRVRLSDKLYKIKVD
jgi:hypothetical protein